MSWKRSLLWGSGLALTALVALLGSSDTTLATFEPQQRFCFEDFSTPDPNAATEGDPGECDGVDSAGAAADFRLGFSIPQGDANFAAIVTYLPNEWNITRGDEFPIGTKVGILEAIATIGIINGACNNTLRLIGTGGFELYNASTDISDTIEFQEEGGGDPTRQDWAEDLDENGLFDGVEKYPAFINRLLKDADDKPLQPIRRSAGGQIVATADVLLQYLIFEPGTFVSKNLSNDPALGYPTVVLLQNAGDPDLVPEPGPITDFCSPLGASVTNVGKGDPCDSVVNDDEDDDDLVNDGCPAIGTPESEAEPTDGGDPCANSVDDDRNDDWDASRAAGRGEVSHVNDGCPKAGDGSEENIEYVLYRNPDEEGTYTFTTIAVGQPDADGDGLENGLDTCPFDANAGDPRELGDGDADSDGLDSACDPDDNEINSDQDLDGYVNRQDNCPLEANGDEGTNQKESDVDADSDRQIDGIGDECDTDPTVFNGEPLEERMRTLTTEAAVGPPAPGQTPAEETPTADGGGDDGGGSSSTIIIIIAIIAGVVVVGGGAFYFMRRGGGGGGGTT